jgi:hypothetical protein
MDYGTGSAIQVLLQLCPGALVCCCVSTPSLLLFFARVERNDYAIGLKEAITVNAQAID